MVGRDCQWLRGDMGARVFDRDACQRPMIALGESGGDGSAGGADEHLSRRDRSRQARFGGDCGIETVRVVFADELIEDGTVRRDVNGQFLRRIEIRQSEAARAALASESARTPDHHPDPKAHHPATVDLHIEFADHHRRRSLVPQLDMRTDGLSSTGGWRAPQHFDFAGEQERVLWLCVDELLQAKTPLASSIRSGTAEGGHHDGTTRQIDIVDVSAAVSADRCCEQHSVGRCPRASVEKPSPDDVVQRLSGTVPRSRHIKSP